jgi:ABC-type multidrug transport system fused ATPase/permease subunit
VSPPADPARDHGGDIRRAATLVRRYAGGQRRVFGGALVVLLLEAATAVLEAYPLAYLIDFLRNDRSALELPLVPLGPTGSTVLILTLGVLVLAAVNSAADSWAAILLARGGQALGYHLRVALFGQLQRLSLAYHDRRRTGDVITRVTGDVTEVEEFVTDSVGDLIASFFLLFGVLGFLLFNSWQVMLVGLLLIPLLALVSNYYAVRIKKAARKQRAREGDLASTTQEMLTSIRVVQTFGRTKRSEKRFRQQSGQAMDAAYETARLEAWFSWVWRVLRAIAIGAVVWIGIFLVDRGALTVGILVMCVLLIEEMFKPTRRIIKEWNKIGKLFASVERIAEVLEREAAVADAPGALAAPRLSGRVEFRNVSFAYKLDPQDADSVVGPSAELRQALSDVSFAATPGEVVALVGHSGAGKSTIAQLVPRLYDPQEGEVLLDGVNVRAFTLESLRAQISVVLQETVLFSGTVAENISYGKEDATRAEIVDAAKQANAHEFIIQMPEGYDTELSERASNLSGGQRQRLAIARALIRNTPILILDEPTTGLDAESTELVLRALRTLMAGKTTLLISHDLGLIRSADRILVLRAGEIEQEGTHDDLLRRGGLYSHLYAKQFEVTATSSAAGAGARPGDRFHDLLAEVQRLSATMRARAAADARGEKGPTRSPPDGAHPAAPAPADGAAPGGGTDGLPPGPLVRELPGLEVALDGDAMGDHLQQALIGAGAGRPVIVRCDPGKIAYLPGEACLIRYRVELSGADGRTHRALLGGRLCRDHAAARAFVRERLEPLARRVRGRDETAPFTVPVAALRALPMAVFAFPIDADLPTLLAATDARHMLEVFRELSAERLGSFAIEACDVELAHYPRRSHCLLRYELRGRLGPAEAERRVVYGKVARNGGARTGDVLAALRQVAASHPGPAFAIPRFLDRRPELDLSLVEAIPGSPRIASLIKARIAGTEGGGGVSLEEAVAECARIAAVLHRSSVDVDLVRTLDDELEGLELELATVRRLAPDLAVRLDAWADHVAGLGAALAPSPVGLLHGDLTPSQVVFDDDGRSGLLDFDSICRGEPELDLGHFCAYVRAACRKAERALQTRSSLADDLCARFQSAYVDAGGAVEDGARLRARAGIYEATSLLRMALHSWHQLKAARTSAVLSVLEERMAWLGTPARALGSRP